MLNNPQDIVPPKGLTADTLRHLNATIGQQIEQREPGELIDDVDGNPLAVGAPQHHIGTLANVAVTAAEVQAAGLTPADIPNIDIIETRNSGE